MKYFLTIIIALFCIFSNAAEYSPSMNFSFEGESDRGDERTLVSMGSEVRIDLGLFHFNFFRLGPTTLYTIDFEESEEPVARWNSIAPLVASSFKLSEYNFDLGYSFNMTQDNQLVSRYKVDGFHRVELEVSKLLSPEIMVSFGGEYIHFEGGVPRLYSTPHNSFKLYLDADYSLSYFNVGTKLEWRQESVIRETMRINTVYDQVLLIPYLKKRFF